MKTTELINAENQIEASENLVYCRENCDWVCLRSDWDAAAKCLATADYDGPVEAYQAMCDAITAILDQSGSTEQDREAAEKYAAELDELCPDWRERFFGEED